MKFKTIFILCFSFLFQLSNVFAQYPLLKHYTEKDGLPSSTIYKMMQDKDGFIWFGTDIGVTRFDGKRFQNFNIADGLSDNDILCVKSDSKNRIWFLGFNGAASYWLNGKIYNESSDTLLKNIKANGPLIDLFEDYEKKLWFISQNRNIIVQNNKVVKPSDQSLIYGNIILNGKNSQIGNSA
jgi:ligand-binding sensor domain-containing protein